MKGSWDIVVGVSHCYGHAHQILFAQEVTVFGSEANGIRLCETR